MKDQSTGKLVLSSFPSENTHKIIQFLAPLYKKVPKEKLDAFISNPPVVLSKQISTQSAQKIIAGLRKIGATAQFITNTSTTNTKHQGKHSKVDKYTNLQKLLLDSFKQSIPKVPVPFFYRFGLFIVSIAMLLLPLIYFALLGLAAYGVYWHATTNTSIILEAEGSKQGALLLYITPIVVGSIILFFLFKPILAKSYSGHKPIKVAPGKEPLLFAFVKRLCEIVGAPVPSEIHLDNEVNASAGFLDGWKGFFKNQLVLTIGLPLTAGLDIQQFTGVLAHEFGHFAQTTGMRMTYIIRSINYWFQRVVYEEDEWDYRIRIWSERSDFRIRLILYITRMFIWLSRKVLWLLMQLGHIISSFMLRQMEYDADRYETSLIGSDVFASTEQKMLSLVMAYEWAFYDLQDLWVEEKLVDNFPSLILAREKQLTKESLKKAEKQHELRGIAKLLSTHPGSKDRIQNSRSLKVKPHFKIEDKLDIIHSYFGTESQGNIPSASILFREFENISKSVSLEMYNRLIGKKINPGKLIRVSEATQKQDTESDYFKALERYFFKCFNHLRPFGISLNEIRSDKNSAELVETINSAKGSLLSIAAKQKIPLKFFHQIYEKEIDLARAEALVDAGIEFSPKEFGLKSADPGGINKAQHELTYKLERVIGELEPFETVIHTRLVSALQLIRKPAMSEKLEKLEGNVTFVDNIIECISKLEPHLSTITYLERKNHAFIILLHLLSEAYDEDVFAKAQKRSGNLCKELSGFKHTLDSISYPFEHSDTGMTLGKFAIGKIPQPDEFGEVAEVIEDATGKIFQLYTRLYARLAYYSEYIEKVM